MVVGFWALVEWFCILSSMCSMYYLRWKRCMFVRLQYSFGLIGLSQTWILAATLIIIRFIEKNTYLASSVATFMTHLCALYALTLFIPLADDPQIHRTMAYIQPSELWDEFTALNAAMLESAKIL